MNTSSSSGTGTAGSAPPSVLLTGAAGFVGSQVAQVLSQRGHRVVGVDAVESSRSHELAELGGFEFRRLDLRDLAALEPAVADVEAIVHLAAVRTQGSRANARDAHDVNVGSTFDLLTLATRHGLGRFVFGSTNTLYGSYQDPSAPPYREDQPWVCRGINMYAATKLASEAYLEAFAGTGGPAYLALRIGPIYGPRVAPGSNASLILDVVTALDKGERPVAPWTKDSVHSFVYVGDVVQAVVAAVTAPRTGLAVNVVGPPVTAEVFFTRLVELYGYDPALIEWTGTRRRYQNVSQDLVRDVLGFAPSTTVDEGLQAFIDWHRSEA